MTPSNRNQPRLSEDERLGLYAARRFINRKIEEAVGLKLHFDTYFQDPLVAQLDPEIAFDEELIVNWEPSLSDGPTSSRLAVVDYNGDTGLLSPPAIWDADQQCFVNDNGILDRHNSDNHQFHQLNVWALLQRTLEFFEEGNSLGRPIAWGFEGNRLIVVPHAGYGQNAYYDRSSKSLQFYYFDGEHGRVYTCLSADIIHHEFGHAVLDGVRPLFNETLSVETAAFHEFVGDLSAILLVLRNNAFRNKIVDATGGDMDEADRVADLAEQFGSEVKGKPYLRTAMNSLTMQMVTDQDGPHHISQVLTGAMFDIVRAISRHYVEKRNMTARQGFWNTIQRMQRMAIQPLDLLPPVDVTFRDYALAVLRAEELSNTTDPHGYRDIMIDSFVRRRILSADDASMLRAAGYTYDRLPLKVYHSVEVLGSSRYAAYRYLDDNRTELYIPHNQDIVVSDLYRAHKLTRQKRRLPRQTVLLYTWREDVKLKGSKFGRFEGQTASLLCGGTLVFDDEGNVMHWARKPGTEIQAGKDWEKEAEHGKRRRKEFLETITTAISQGRVGNMIECSQGLLQSRTPPFVAHMSGDNVRFQLSPHFSIVDGNDNQVGDRKWEISS